MPKQLRGPHVGDALLVLLLALRLVRLHLTLGLLLGLAQAVRLGCARQGWELGI